jgi:hypothetical protein
MSDCVSGFTLRAGQTFLCSRKIMKHPLIAILVTSVMAFSFCGCGKKDPGGAPVTPARQTSFDAVTRQLDSGGSVYGYLSTDQWLAGLSTNVAQFGSMLAGLSDVPGLEKDRIQQITDLIAHGIQTSGLENLDGIGVSGIQITPELHRTKFILHHGKGRGDGVLWNLMGKKPHALDGLDLLTTNTAMASFGDLDVALLWRTLENGLRDVPEVSAVLREWPGNFERKTGMSWSSVIDSLEGEAGLVLTLDHSKKFVTPGEEPMEFPEPGLLIAVKVKNDLLYDRISGEMNKSGMAQTTNGNGIKMTAMRFPIPLPIDLEITVASAEGYLFLASSTAMVRNALEVRGGRQPGLRKSAECVELMKYLPAEGNHFFYMDRRFSSTIQEVQKEFLSRRTADAPQGEFIQKLLLSQPPAFGMSVSGHTETGWQSVSVGNQDSATALVAAPAVGAVAVASAMLLPALAKAKGKAGAISCVNNMKQIGLAFRVWSGDNDDQFPFNVSRDKGGTLELCDRDSEGFDLASYRHFQVMSNELSAAKILVCPGDDSKEPAASFEDIQPENVSYLVRSGKEVNETNPEAVLTYCPIHHNFGYADGSVRKGSAGE